ncbi:MAG TPA: glycosyltransferase family 4 protein [Candidatus Brocadiia bacterium]|nr:glycosyltransferase family 4 protein [Candidatus Brocadiia bacterium]
MTKDRILHLFSNFRKTGPAEPMLNLCVTLQSRGWDISAAFSKPLPWNDDDLTDIAAGLGIKVVRGFNLDKHFLITDDFEDISLLTRYIREARIRLIHAHMDNDHLVAAMAARRGGYAVKVVRSFYDSGAARKTFRTPFMYGRATDMVIAFSENAADSLARTFRLPKERVTVVDGAVDLRRFDPGRGLDGARRELGLDAQNIVIGIVARVQARRRFDLLLEAFKQASESCSSLRLLIVGRGGGMEEVAIKPAERMGVRDKVIFTGYRPGDEYVRTLNSMDAKVYLIPGTDGTCRAVREAMAMGRPIIATRRGMLPELVDDGKTGLLVDETPAALAEAMLKVAGDAGLRARLGAAAREKALGRFSLEQQAERIEAVYHKLLGGGAEIR